MALKTAQGRPRRHKRRRGAVLVETALTLPVILLAIFAIIEFGFMLRDFTSIRGTGQEAIRAAAISGDDFEADFHILEVITAAAAPMADDAITRIVVFRADSADALVPPSCLVGSQDTATVKCNTYLPADFTRPVEDFGCQTALNVDRFWCPSDRVVIQSVANGGPPDFIGIYIEVERQLLTGFFGGSQTLRRTNILPLEPRDV